MQSPKVELLSSGDGLGIGRHATHAERGHDHVEADERPVDERVLDAGLALDVLRHKRKQDRDDAHLPDPGAFACHIRMPDIVACLRQSREERGDEIAEKRSEDRFTRKPDRDRQCAEDEDSRIDGRPLPVALPDEGSRDDEQRGDAPADLDVGLVIARRIGQVEPDHVEDEDDRPGGEVGPLVPQPDTDGIEAGRERAEHSAKHIQGEGDFLDGKFFHGDSFRCRGVDSKKRLSKESRLKRYEN